MLFVSKKKNGIGIVAFALVFWLLPQNGFSLSCAESSTHIDTIGIGIVEVKKCYSSPDAPCTNPYYLDTLSQSDLMDSLLDTYQNKKYAVIGTVDSVFSFTPQSQDTGGPIIGGTALPESVHVVINRDLKGNFPQTQLWFEVRPGFWDPGYSNLRGKQFIAFFDLYDSLSQWGIGPGGACDFEISGYFIENGQIKQLGAVGGMPGISITLEEFEKQIDLGTLPTRDTLVVIPGAPTTQDSITLRLFIASQTCNTVYDETSLSIQGKQIFLSFTVNPNLQTRNLCLTTGNWIAFKTGALKAGTYEVFKAEGIYCAPKTACPLVVIAPLKMGEFQVSRFSSLRRTPNTSDPSRVNVFPNPFSKSVTIRLDRGDFGIFGMGTVEIFSIDGKRINRFDLINQLEIQWKPRDLSEGTYLIKIKQGKNQFAKKVFLRR